MKGIDNMDNITNKENNSLTVFQHEEFGEIHVVEIDNKPWFVGKDVAAALGYSNTKNAVPKHVDDEDKLRTQIEYAGQKRDVTVINESGLYSLILSSKLESAKKFKHWVTNEVLPSIREHGAYLTPDTMAKVMQDPDFIIQLVQTIKEQQIENKALKGEIQEMKPKVEFADAVLSSDSSIGVGAFAKLLRQNGVEIGQKRLFAWLRENDYLISREGREHNNPTQYSIEHGWIEGHESVIKIKDTTVIKITPLITPAGQQYFAKKLQDYKKS